MSPTFDIEVEFDVYCTCGAPLCYQSETEDYRRGHGRRVTIAPCQRCLDTQADESYNTGYCDAEKEVVG